MNQEASSQQTPDLPVPWPWTSQPPGPWERNVLFISHLVCYSVIAARTESTQRKKTNSVSLRYKMEWTHTQPSGDERGRGPKRKRVRERLGEDCQTAPSLTFLRVLALKPPSQGRLPHGRIFKGKPNAGLPDPPPLLDIPPRSTRCVFYSPGMLHIFLVYLLIFWSPW